MPQGLRPMMPLSLFALVSTLRTMSSALSPGHAQAIREHLKEIRRLRVLAADDGLLDAVTAIKQFQTRRFAATYADCLRGGPMCPAAQFFLDELYGPHDFSQRDAQFDRIAGSIERLFPAHVGQLAENLARLHCLSETLDLEMARHWLSCSPASAPDERYVASWQQTGAARRREEQLQLATELGQSLSQLTRMKPLRLALRMMRAPARAAGLAALQRTLEAGFDAFAALPDAQAFLSLVHERETQGIRSLFQSDRAAALAWLRSQMGDG